MYLDPDQVMLEKLGDRLVLFVDGARAEVARIARAFPKTNPDGYVSFLDVKGHEVGIVESPSALEASSRALLEEELKRVYFVPTIREIQSVERQGTGTAWGVLTDDGERTFRVAGRDMLDGDRAPAILVTDDAGHRYRIDDYWSLDRRSRALIKDMIPDKVIRAKLLAHRMDGMRGGGMRSGGGPSHGGSGRMR